MWGVANDDNALQGRSTHPHDKCSGVSMNDCYIFFAEVELFLSLLAACRCVWDLFANPKMMPKWPLVLAG